jgi:hypothetical protein
MDPKSAGWEQVESWRKRGENFLVEVKHFEAKSYADTALAMNEGPHRWALYAYLYPQHPFFGECDPQGGMWQRVACYLSGHMYCSFSDVHARLKKDGTPEVTSFQFGWDYHHLDYDERYTQMEPGAADAVFADGERLFEYLKKGVLE